MNDQFGNDYGYSSEFPYNKTCDDIPLSPEQLLIKRRENIKKARKIFSGLCFCLVAFLFIEYLGAAVFYSVLGIFLDEEMLNRYNVILSTVLVHLILFPILALILRAFPKSRIVRKKKSAGYLAAGFCVCVFAMFLGAIIGNIVNSQLTALTGVDPGNIVESGISGASIPELIIFVAVIPGIVEEFVFRKLLIDRTAKYSGVGSVLFSGLLFGLIHGNFEQFFYAFFVGIVFAVVYLNSGNIWYSAIMHIMMNIFGSVIPTMIGDSTVGLILFALAELVIVGVGLAFLIVYTVKLSSSPLKAELVNEDDTLQPNDADPSLKTGDCFKAIFLNPGMIVFVLLSIASFMLYFISLPG